jgi:hypothetical protein
MTTAANLKVAPHLQHLYMYLLENRFIEDLHGYNPSLLPIFSREVAAKIRSREMDWERMVPPEAARLIRTRGLFGYLPRSIP